MNADTTCPTWSREKPGDGANERDRKRNSEEPERIENSREDQGANERAGNQEEPMRGLEKKGSNDKVVEAKEERGKQQYQPQSTKQQKATDGYRDQRNAAEKDSPSADTRRKLLFTTLLSENKTSICGKRISLYHQCKSRNLKPPATVREVPAVYRWWCHSQQSFSPWPRR